MFSKIARFVKDNLGIIFVILGTFLVYKKSINFELTHFDDASLITGNLPFLTNFDNIINSFKVSVFQNLHAQDDYYRPLMLVSLIFDTKFYLTFPQIYHLTNLIIHICNIFLVYVLLKALKISKNTSLILSIFFAIHPVLVSGISWIPGRNDTLLTFFVLNYLILIIKYFSDNNNNYLLIPISLFFILSIFTKETGLMCFVITVLYSFLFTRNKLKEKKLYKVLLIETAISVFWFFLRKNAITNPTNLKFSDSIVAFFKNFPGFFVYVSKIFFPLKLSTNPTFEMGQALLGLLLVIIFIVFGLRMFKKRMNIGVYLFGLIFFLLFLVPSFWGSLPEIEFLLLEHRIYLPIVGFLIAIGGIKTFNDSIDNNPLFLLIVSIILVFYLFSNIKHQESYRNQLNFWQNAVSTSPNLSRSHFGMGTYYRAVNDFENAEKELLLANKLNPKQGGIKNNLGALYLDNGRLVEAKKLFEEELAVRKDPYLYFNYGLTLYRLGEFSKAKSAWLEGLKIDPENTALLTKMFLYESENKNIFGAEYYRNELLKQNIKI